MKEVLQQVQNIYLDTPIMKMKANLEILLGVLDSHINEKESSEREKQKRVLAVLKELRLDQFVRSIIRYSNDGNYNSQLSD